MAVQIDAGIGEGDDGFQGFDLNIDGVGVAVVGEPAAVHVVDLALRRAVGVRERLHVDPGGQRIGHGGEDEGAREFFGVEGLHQAAHDVAAVEFQAVLQGLDVEHGAGFGSGVREDGDIGHAGAKGAPVHGARVGGHGTYLG